MSNLTVILPVRNGEAFIASAIRSVLNQTFKDFEFWILENGSDDRTVEIVKSVTDPRIKIFELGPVRMSGAIQYALENASTEWLARMDADDLMFRNRLERQMNFLRGNPDVVFVGTTYAYLTPSGHMIERILSIPSREVSRELLFQGRFFADPSVVFNRHAALEVGGTDPAFPNWDLPLWFRLLTKGKGWEIAENLHVYRLHASSVTREKDAGEQPHRVRLKYVPDLVATHKARQSYSFWQYVAQLELISGEAKFVRSAAKHMKQEGPFNAEANRMILRSFLGKPGCIYYRWRNRHTYRRRVDWEQLFKPLLSTAEKG